MYKEFYGFSEDPFAPNPDPRFLFVTENRKKILDSLVYGIKERKGFSLVTGEAGTGKTSLIRDLMPMLDSGIKTILIDQPSRTFDELLEDILRDLGLPVEERSKSSMLWQLNEYLHQMGSLDETLLICVDEAHEMNEKVMEELRLLGNPDPRRPGPGVVQEVFVGNPEIEEKLNSKELRQLLQRISVKCRLDPLSETESRQYIEHRLDKVGRSVSDVFTPTATELICRYGEGIPRDINTLCSVALSAGYALSRDKVDADVVEGISSILDRRNAGGRQPGGTLLKGLMRQLESSSAIMKATYMLWAYSLLALLALFCLRIFF